MIGRVLAPLLAVSWRKPAPPPNDLSSAAPPPPSRRDGPATLRGTPARAGRACAAPRRRYIEGWKPKERPMKLSARNIISGKVTRIAPEITASDVMLAVD
jgi:hypothetical protein